MIRNIVFDIGMVLIGFEPFEWLRSMFDEETADRIAYAVYGTGHWEELDKAILSEEEILELFISEAPDLKEQILEAYDRVGECVKKKNWPVPLIDLLKKNGYSVYFLSNMSEHVINSNHEAFAFTEHMDGGIWSCDVHMIKPDPGIYKCLFDKYNLVPEECLFVDDREINLAGAAICGMQSMAFRTAEDFLRQLKERGIELPE